MKAKEKAGLPATVAPDSALVALRQEFPTEPAFNRVLLPRLGLISQDKTEGKGKAMKVIAEAGTFFVEKQTDEVDEESGKKVWERTEIGTELEAIILYQRKQLRMYDEKTEQYTSSPVYDSEDEILPLFCDKQEVGRGTPKELQAKYEYTGKDKKVRSALEVNRIVYVLYEDEVYQLNLRGTSMYAYLAYGRKVTPNTVVTSFGSVAKENGDIAWNQMTFEPARKISAKEAKEVMEKIGEIKAGIAQEKGFYAGQQAAGKEDDPLKHF